MKKLSVLLIAAAVALSAAAGTANTRSYRVADVKDSKVKLERGQMHANINRFKRGSTMEFSASPLRAMDWTARPAVRPKFKSENTIMWDFEDEGQLQDWSMIDADGDGHCWEYANTSGQVTHSGTGVVSSASYDNDTYMALTPDNWLISPAVSLEGTLVFYAAGQDPSYARETFAVYVAIGEPGGTTDFVKISEDITVNGTIKEYIFDLSEFQGQQGCIAIRHYNSTDQFRLNIDDVTITTEEVIPEPEPEAPEVITEIPERCEVKTYFRNSGTILYHWLLGIYARPTAGKFQVAFDPENNDVYIKNPIWNYEPMGVWIKGTIDPATGIITVPTGQYLYWDEVNEYGLQLVWGDTYIYENGVDEETGETAYSMKAEVDERTTEFHLQIDGDNIYLLDTYGDIFLPFPEWGNSSGLMCVYDIDNSWDCSEFANFDREGNLLPFGVLANIVPAVPANPTADNFEDCGSENGFTKFYFTLPYYDVDGNMLDMELVSYSMWVDNGNGPEIYVFKESDYYYDTEGMGDLTEIPYEVYYGGYDFMDYMVYLYRTNAEGYEPLFTENIGIQAHYTVDGIKNSSEIAWLYPTEPQEKTYQLVMLDMNGNPVAYDLTQGENGEYTTTVALNYDVFGGFDPMTEERPAVPFYFLVNGVRYGANADMTAAVLGMAMENPLAATDGCYTVPVGYNYNIGIAIGLQGEMYAYVAQAGFTGVNDINAGKTVANVRYYNVTGQEMAQPAGMTIQVTTYTDGTTSTAKVVK